MRKIPRLLGAFLVALFLTLIMTNVVKSSPCDPSPNRPPRSAEYLVQRQYCLFLAYDFYSSSFFRWSRIKYERCNKCMELRYGLPPIPEEEGM